MRQGQAQWGVLHHVKSKARVQSRKNSTCTADNHVTIFQSPTIDSSSVRPVLNSYFERFRLSARETEAIVFLAQGQRAKEIAEHMSCSEKTVYAHLARVCKKTNCRDFHEVVCAILAFACDILDDAARKHPSFGRRLFPRC